MLRLVRYLRPYLLLIVITIVLLFVQANADLALPDYLSHIVNVGIQQGGVENAVPVAIRQSQMERLLVFMSAEEQAQWLEHCRHRLIEGEAGNRTFTGFFAEIERIRSEEAPDERGQQILSEVESFGRELQAYIGG